MKEILTKDELSKFNEEQGDKLVVLDFYAEWCNPCKVLGGVIESIYNEGHQFELVKVNVDNAEELTSEYKIRNIPTLIFMKSGFVIDKSVGAISIDILKEKININLNK